MHASSPAKQRILCVSRNQLTASGGFLKRCRLPSINPQRASVKPREVFQRCGFDAWPRGEMISRGIQGGTQRIRRFAANSFLIGILNAGTRRPSMSVKAYSSATSPTAKTCPDLSMIFSSAASATTARPTYSGDSVKFK